MLLHNRGKLPMLIIAGALVFVLLITGVAVVVLKGKGKHGKQHKEEKVPTVEMALGEFVVNLADTAQIRYLKTDIVIALAGELKAEGKGEGEGEAKAPAPIRDAVISVLSSRTFADLVKQHGREKLKEDLIVAINKQIKEQKAEVKEVFFSEFAMQ